MTWQKQKPYKGTIHQGCPNCPPVKQVADMHMVIAVGFGCAQVWKDEELVFDEMHAERRPRLAEFEEMAAQDSNHDWRVILHAPLRGREYQRHGESKWVLIDSNEGFA